MTPEENARLEAEDFAERILWPDGPVCPYCGERERVVPETDGAESRLRYECPACEGHSGYFRQPRKSGEATDHQGPPRRPILPRYVS